MKYEIQNSDSIDFKNQEPILKVGERYFYKCKFKKKSLIKESTLNQTDLYYITKNYTEVNNGAYLSINFDSNRENIIFFEYLRKPEEDLEAVEYSILEFLNRLKQNINDFEKSTNGFKYFNKNI